MEEVKVIKLLNLVKEMFDYDDIDELIFGVDYSDEFNLFSERLNNIFSDGINEKCLNMISKLAEKEIFYLEIGDEYINNDIRKKIVEYLDNQILYFDFENVKKYIKNNYELASYLKDKSKLLDLISENEKVILLLEPKYLTEEFVLNEMQKSDFICEVFLGKHGIYNNLYQHSLFYRYNEKINELLYNQTKQYLDDDIYCYIKASWLVKTNYNIAKFVLNLNPKFYHYMDDKLKKVDELKQIYENSNN